MLPKTAYEEKLNANIALLTKEVEAHPDTQFIFFYPPYSLFWWDMTYRAGETDAVIYCEKQMTKALLQYDNVKIFCFQNDTETTTNLDLYMDTIHFSAEINRRMLDLIVEGQYEMTLDNYEEIIDGVKDFSDRVQNEYMPYYEQQDLLTYETLEE